MENNEPINEPIVVQDKNNGSKQIAGAILLAGVLIAGAVMLKGNVSSDQAIKKVQDAADVNNPKNLADIKLVPVSAEDHTLGDAGAELTVIEYADFQCPFCGMFHEQTLKPLKKDYVDSGKVRFVYRDYAFLGEESTKSAEASHCASDQGKFWEYHDYLFTHQNGENRGAFADNKLKSFAKTLGLNSATFDQCLDSDKYYDRVMTSATNGTIAGVTGTPKGFIIKGGKVVATIDGAEPYVNVKAKIEKALK